MLFVTSCAVSIGDFPIDAEMDSTTTQGFIFGALINVWLTDRLGFGKVISLLEQ